MISYSEQNIASAKEKFLDAYNKERTIEKALSQANGAATRRARLFTLGLNHKEREPVRTHLREFLSGLPIAYQEKMGQTGHHSQIKLLKSTMNRLPNSQSLFSHTDFPKNPGFRIAHAQKSISVFLKHLWCMGKVATPPECPVDAVILRKVGIRGIAWTAVDCIEEHKTIIARIQDIVGNASLSEWELINFAP
jgi:hypothetical protein